MEFSERNLDGEEALVELREEINFFVLLHSGVPGQPPFAIRAGDVRELQELLVRGLGKFRRKKIWTMEFGSRVGIGWDPQRGVYRLVSAGLKQRFLTAVSELLLRVGSGLRICDNPRCFRFFAMRRPVQKYCSKRCTNQVMVSRYRERHPEKLSERRHRQYKRKYPPNVKVTRRKRKERKS